MAKLAWLSALLKLLCLSSVVVDVCAENSRGIPLTIEGPPKARVAGRNYNLRYHLAHFGAVPYGEEFPRYEFDWRL
jgi:hypothetical protein